MKKGLLFVTASLLLGGLVGCGSTTEKKADFSGLKDKLETTVKATYTSNYRLDVHTENVGAKGFERQVDDVVTIEADYTPGNLYLHTKRVGREFQKDQKTTYETLLFKDGADYKFLTSTMENAVVIPTEEKALAKINYLLLKSSKRNGGFVDSNTFLYTTGKTYEHHQFLMDSTNVGLSAFNDKINYKATKEGITATTKLSQVGYLTDQGTSELFGEPAANLTLKMTNEGYVTSYKETFEHAKLEMPIFQPAPILDISGTRELAAAYGETLEKLTTIAHEAVYGTVTLSKFNGGSAKLYSAAPEHLAEKVEIHSGDQILADNWLVVELTLTNASGVTAVMNNNNGETVIEPTNEGKVYTYVFEAQVPTNTIVISLAGVAYETVTVRMPAREAMDEYFVAGKVKLVSFILNSKQQAEDIKTITNGKIEIKPSAWGAIAVEEGGFKKDPANTMIFQNEKATMALPIEGTTYFAWSIKDEVREHVLTVGPKEAKPVEPEVTEGSVITIPAAFVGCTAKVYAIDANQFQDLNDAHLVKNGQKVAKDKWVCVKLNDDALVAKATVKLGEQDPMIPAAQAGNYFCFKATTEPLTLSITIADAANADKVVVTSTLPEGVTLSKLQTVEVPGHAGPDMTTAKDITADGLGTTKGHTTWIVMDFTVAEGSTIESVTVNGVAASTFGPSFGYMVPVVGTYNIVVTLAK